MLIQTLKHPEDMELNDGDSDTTITKQHHLLRAHALLNFVQIENDLSDAPSKVCFYKGLLFDSSLKAQLAGGH